MRPERHGVASWTLPVLHTQSDKTQQEPTNPSESMRYVVIILHEHNNEVKSVVKCLWGKARALLRTAKTAAGLGVSKVTISPLEKPWGAVLLRSRQSDSKQKVHTHKGMRSGGVQRPFGFVVQQCKPYPDGHNRAYKSNARCKLMPRLAEKTLRLAKLTVWQQPLAYNKSSANAS